MFKKLLQKGKCLLGFHEGEWKYDRAANCSQTRVCTRCKKQQQRFYHVWGEWEFEREADCAQRRACQRCGKHEERVAHNWAASKYVEEGSCEQMRSCARCAAEEPTGACHQWGRWEYRAANDCTQHLICDRCGARHWLGNVEHLWSDWQQRADYEGAIRVCRRCGEMEGPQPAASQPALTQTIAAKAVEALPVAQSDFRARCDMLLADFERALKKQGYSEYLLQQANADFKQLQPESEDDQRTLRKALVRMCDIAIPQAPPEAAQTLLVSREFTLQLDAPPLPPLDAAGLEAEGETLLQRLRDELASGGFPSPAIARAQMTWQALILRLREDDEEESTKCAKVFMRIGPEMMAIIAPYAEADKATLAADTTSALQQAFAELETVLGDDEVQADVAAQAAVREIKRTLQGPTGDPSEEATAPRHLQQFASLLRPWMNRVMALRTLRNDSRDEAEAERIARHAEIAANRLKAATTEAQWIEQQRGSFRRVALDLRQFERRHHLMLIEPSWPTAPTAVDANAVFFSGTPEVQAVLESASALIGMGAPVTHGLDDVTHTRWDLLRRSALAVFDFTSYDRAASDPPGGLPRAGGKREAIARAAAPVARVAYEYGWALVLGTASVMIAREGQTLPFDIDIEPVYLAGDAENDAIRVVLGLQAALLGVQRELHTADLAATVARLRELFGNDEKATPLLDALAGSRDAMQAQFGAESLLERAGAGGAMLALPVFPPVYPNAEQPPTLFHVTAFRPWSKPCEEMVRDACSRDGMKYLIGYERVDPDILRAIWRDIAGASFVVVDLTSLNPNAALELGIAQALGRPTLVLTQTPNLAQHFQPIAKVRTHLYATSAAGKLDLAGLLDRHLQSVINTRRGGPGTKRIGQDLHQSTSVTGDK